MYDAKRYSNFPQGKDVKKNEEVILEIESAAFEELEAYVCNTQSMFQFKRTLC